MVIDLNIALKNKEKSEKILLDFKELVINSTKQAIKKHTVGIQEDTKAEIKDGKKTGRWYPYNGRFYQASAEGEVAAFRSGDLYRSIKNSISNQGFTGKIRTNIFYAKYLVGHLKRKIFQPSFDAHARMLIDSIRAGLKRK
jgi:hypothetical protein